MKTTRLPDLRDWRRVGRSEGDEDGRGDRARGGGRTGARADRDLPRLRPGAPRRRPRCRRRLPDGGARVLSADGTELAGHEQAFELLRQITASTQALEIRIGRCVIAGDVALATQYWRRSCPGPGGHDSSTIACLVMVRSGARWKIAIASPWE